MRIRRVRKLAPESMRLGHAITRQLETAVALLSGLGSCEQLPTDLRREFFNYDPDTLLLLHARHVNRGT